MHHGSLSNEELAVLSTPASVPRPSSPTTNRGGDAEDEAHPSLLELHLQFATSLGDAISRCVNHDVAARMREQSVATYAQFVFGQPIPTCCAIICAEPTNLEFYVAIQPTILYPLIDRLAGGKQSDPIPQRPLTEIEVALTHVILDRVVAKYGDGWRQALSLDLQVDRIEHNVQRLGALAGSEPTYRARYGVRSGTDYGQLEVCLPWRATHQIRQRLATSQ